MKIPEELKYVESHEWVRVEGDTVYIGITDYAQDALGDIVFVEIPEINEEYRKGEEVTTIESVKSVSSLYAPVSGTLIKVNDSLDETPELINQKPYEAFIFAIKMNDPSELTSLLDAKSYQETLD